MDKYTLPGWLKVCALLLALAAFALACGDVSDASVNDQETIFTIAQSNASNPTVAIDSKTGTVYIAWIGSEETGSNVYLAKKEKTDTRFSEPLRVNDQPGEGAPHLEAPPQVGVGPEGQVYVLWHYNIEVEGRRFPASNLRFARSLDGGATFSSAIHVNDDFDAAPTSHNFHNMAVAGDGNIYIAWLDGRDREKSPQVRVARSLDSGLSFSAGAIVADKVCTCCRIAITVDIKNHVYVAYRDASETNIRDISISHSVDQGNSFSTPKRLHNDNWYLEGCPHNGPGLDIDNNGNVHLTWYTGAESHGGVHYAVANVQGDLFSEPLHLNSRFKDTPMRAKVVGLNVDEALVACEVIDDDGTQIYLIGPGFGPDGPEQIVPIGSGSHPVIAKGQEQIALAWLDKQSVKATIKKM